MRPEKALPSIAVGNRAMLENRPLKGVLMIVACQENVDLMTAAVLPKMNLSKQERILITAILNQIEIHFVLHRSGAFNREFQSIQLRS